MLWRKNLGQCIRLLSLGESRILGLTLSFDSKSIMFLNVYLPYSSADNPDEYLDSLGKIESIIDVVGDSSEIIILGDLIAAVDCSISVY